MELAQSMLGPHFSSGTLEKSKYWTYLLPNLFLWVESNDGKSISVVKAQLPSLNLENARFDLPELDLTLGEMTFGDFNSCERPPELHLWSRGVALFEVCTIGGFGVYHNYSFGAFSGIKVSYEDESFSAFLDSGSRAPTHDEIGEVKVNYVVMSRADHKEDPWPIDWFEAFGDEYDESPETENDPQDLEPQARGTENEGFRCENEIL